MADNPDIPNLIRVYQSRGAQRLEWGNPVNTDFTRFEVSRASAKYGAYSIVTTANLTSDGAEKVASNTWISTYGDTSGARTDWYKIRFGVGTASYSPYSASLTQEFAGKLCSIDDVKGVIDTVGRFTDTEIYNAILEVEDDIYTEMGTPIYETISDITTDGSSIFDTYYVGEENIYRIDRVFVGTSTKHELFEDDGFKTNERYGMIRFLPVASGGTTLSTQWTTIIRYVPNIFHRIAKYRTAKFLLEKVDYATGGAVSKELEVINNRLETVEQILMSRVGFMLSSSRENYNPVYGVNSKVIPQDHDRNSYIASYGW